MQYLISFAPAVFSRGFTCHPHPYHPQSDIIISYFLHFLLTAATRRQERVEQQSIT